MKRFISTALVLVMLLTLMPISVFAAEKEYAAVEGTIMFNAGHDDMETDHPCPFVYSDGYFDDTAYNYRQDLATVTMAMALAAGNVADPARFTEGPANLADFFGQIGFKDFEYNKDFVTRPNRDTFGVGIANKEIVVDGEKFTVIAIGCRGCGYYSEWAGDFNVGAEGEHTGFAICRDTAYSFLQEYLAKHTEIKGNIKIWCTGYSRGAIGSNMLGGLIDDMIMSGKQLSERVSLTLDDVYFYTFEPPMGTVEENVNSNIYNNIHNVINYNDLVVKVPHECMGFARYGVDHVMPSYGLDANYDELKAAMLEVFNSFENAGEYRIDSFTYITVTPGATAEKIKLTMNGNKMSQGQFLDRLVKLLFTEVIGDRGELYEMQGTLQELVLPFIGAYPDQLDAVKESLASNAGENLKEIMFNLMKKDRDSSIKVITNIILKAFRDAGINDLSADDLKAAIPVVVDLLINLVKNHPDEVATLIFNITGIMSAHYGELGMSWMMSIHDDYMLNKQIESAMPYDDIPRDMWCYNEVKYAYDNELMNGTKLNAFSPNGDVTRGQVVTVLYRLAGEPSVKGLGCPMNDVKGSWCEKAIIWAYNMGIAKGYEDGSFGINQLVTREQLAAFLYRYATQFVYEGEADTGDMGAAFSDYGSVGAFAKPAVNWAIKNMVINGTNDGLINPKGTANRAQFACFISRFAENVVFAA